MLEKWLKDHKESEYKIYKADVDHIRNIIYSLENSIKLMNQIDETIEEYGGWPLV